MLYAAEQAITFSRTTLCLTLVLTLVAIWVVVKNKED